MKKTVDNFHVVRFKMFFMIIFINVIGTTIYSQPLAEGQNKFFGNVYTNTGVPSSFTNYWNQVTPENSGKWGSVENVRDSYNWTNLDDAYQYAKDNNFPFRFHVLIWGKQQPEWIANLDSAEQVEEVEEWIRLAGERYPDAEYVEVVNEAIEFPPYDYYPSYCNALGGAGQTGWDWVIWAFEKARQYFPNSKLILNDYNILSGQKSVTIFLQIVNLLQERNLVDGLGEQAHYFAISYSSPGTIRTNLDRLAATGLPIQITEFEINEADDNTQLQRMQQYFPVFWEHPAVEGITHWGYIEGRIWQENGFLLNSRGAKRPAMDWLRTYIQTVGIEQEQETIPSNFKLSQNYPNPFNPETVIEFTLNKFSDVKLTIHNMLGQEIKVLEEGYFNSGKYSARWNGTDNRNNAVSSGVYFYQLKTDNGIFQKKLVLLR